MVKTHDGSRHAPFRHRRQTHAGENKNVDIWGGGQPFRIVANFVLSLTEYPLSNDGPVFCEYGGRVVGHVANPLKEGNAVHLGVPRRKQSPRDYSVPDVYLGVLVLSTPRYLSSHEKNSDRQLRHRRRPHVLLIGVAATLVISPAPYRVQYNIVRRPLPLYF